MLESVLVGHEDWVHSVVWQPASPLQTGAAQPPPLRQPCLLSASMDRTMMLWRPDAATGGELDECHAWKSLALPPGCICVEA